MGLEITTELITVEPEDALAVFTTAGDVPGKHKGLDPILAKIREKLDAFMLNAPDVSTASGRQEIKSIAFAVAKSKSYLEKVGKGLADEAKALPKRIDAGRNYANTTLDKWRDEIRKPLTDWEEAEEKRINAHVKAIEDIRAFGVIHAAWKASDYQKALDELTAFKIGPQCEEFESNYRAALDQAIQFLTTTVADKKKAEADEAELAALRAEKERREAEEREAERKRQEELRIQEAAAAAERREAELRRKIQEADEREAQARRAKEEEEALRRQREADQAHRAQINSRAVDALVAHAALTVEAARAVVVAIAREQIPSISIHY